MRLLVRVVLLAAAAVLVLAIARPAQAAPVRVSETFSSGNIALPVSDEGASAIAVRGGGPVVGVQVSVRLSHPSVRMLSLNLVSPSGESSQLTEASDFSFDDEADLGAGAADCSGTPARFAAGGASFPDESPPFVGTYSPPDDDFDYLSGYDAYGSWRLELDNQSSRDAVLHCWSVTVIRRAEVARSGDLRAELSYLSLESDSGLPEYANLRLRVLRGDTEILNQPQRKPCAYCDVWPQGANRGSSIAFRQLDRDPAPELVFDFFNGGASCCAMSRIYDERGGHYRETQTNWARDGYQLVRSTRPPPLMFRTGDGRFTCRFAACAFSPSPIQLFSFRAGKLVDVTRAHARLIRRDLARQWRHYQQMKRSKYEITGALAAWMADKQMLGEGAQGWRVLRALERRGEIARFSGHRGRAGYVKTLADFLRRAGYR
jgi:proprotein convertase P-domain-containing protein